LVEIDTGLLGIIVTIGVVVGGGLIALGIKIIRLEERVDQLRNSPPNMLNYLTREQVIELADTMIQRMEERNRGNQDG